MRHDIVKGVIPNMGAKTKSVIEKAKQLNRPFTWKDVLPDATVVQRGNVLNAMIKYGHIRKIKRGGIGLKAEPAVYVLVPKEPSVL